MMQVKKEAHSTHAKTVKTAKHKHDVKLLKEGMKGYKEHASEIEKMIKRKMFEEKNASVHLFL